jgi:hypothetical protein
LLHDSDMTKSIIEIIIDDIDGTEGAVTIEFSYKGISYEIDLAERQEAKMDKALDPFIAAATRVSKRGNKRPAAGPSKSLGAVREWARANGYEVSERGRVPKSVLEAYEAAN